MHFQYMCLATIRVMTLIYHGLRFFLMFLERGGRLTLIVSCGWAPGCGVQFLDWADPRADNKADAKGTYAANGV